MVIQPVSPSIISLQRIISAKPFCFRFYTTPTPPSVSASTRTTRSRHCNYTTARILDYNGCCTLAAPLPCGKFKPKLVQKSFLRKSQDLHLDAVPTTYAQRSLRKRGSHTQALRFGTAQPFWTLSQRCCSKNTNQSKTNKQDKQDGLNHVTVSDYFFAVSLALSQKQPYSLTATIV